MRRFAPVPALAALVFLVSPAGAQAQPSLETWFAKLRPGMWVEVEGAVDSAGVLVAAEIKILDGELDEWQIETVVGAVELPQMSLSTRLGIRVVATEKTELEGRKDGRDVTFALLGADDRVEVEGRLQKDGSLLADKIEIEKTKREKPPKQQHELTARIEQVNAEKRQIRLMGILVQCDAGTRNKTPFVE